MDFWQQYPFLIPFSALLLAEILKIVFDSIKNKKLSFKNFLHSGGFPSGHSALVSSLATLVYFKFSPQSMEFALAMVLAIIVLYDAVNLRGEAGKHAQVLNQLQKKAKLEERLGHTYLQMLAGVVVGILTSLFFYQ